jgi:hypothetical protein
MNTLTKVILIFFIVLIVALAILWLGGIFNEDYGVLGNFCISAYNYSCGTPIYNNSTGNIILKVGQETGTDWTAANFVFVHSGSALLQKWHLCNRFKTFATL